MIRWLWMVALCLLFGACQTLDPQVKHAQTKQTMQDLKTAPDPGCYVPPKAIHKKPAPKTEVVPAHFKKPVTLKLTETVNLKDALIELAHHNAIDLQLDPKVAARVHFAATNQPFIEVVRQLCDMASLRYKIMGSSIRIEPDSPYLVNYDVQFLNLSRHVENRMNTATDVFSTVGTKRSTASDNGSNSALSSTMSTDFWKELEETLETIIAADHDATKSDTNYAIHKQSGVIAIMATQKQHTMVQDYLDKLRRLSSAQVLIEAKIVEVSLKDEFRAGIDWSKLSGGDLRFDLKLGSLAAGARSGLDAGVNTLAVGTASRNFTTFLRLIEQFGATRTLSSPRLTVMNNQPAILKVAQNQVYFRLNYEKLYLNNQNNNNAIGNSVNVSSDIHTVPIGLVLNVQPSIDEQTGEIILSLRPTVSRFSQSVRDPAVDIAAQDSNNVPPSFIPVTEVREIDSVLRLRSGQLAVLGGLMEERMTNADARVPVIGEIPLIGLPLSGEATSSEVVELVLMLRATILRDSDTFVEQASGPDAADQRLHQEQVHDPRV